MKKITEFTKPILKRLRTDMDLALAEVADKYGIEIKGGSWSFTESTVSMKFDAKIDGALSREMSDVELYSVLDTGTSFKYGDKFDFGGGVGVASVVGYKTRSPKYPFIIENSVGRFKIPVDKMKRVVSGA